MRPPSRARNRRPGRRADGGRCDEGSRTTTNGRIPRLVRFLDGPQPGDTRGGDIGDRSDAQQEATMTTDDVTQDTELIDFDHLLKDFDAILDVWFMGEVTPALEEAQRARQATPRAEAA